MAKWTVALFGHFKDIPLESEDPAEYAAAIKRAQPGDVIAFKPWEDRGKWTPNERKEFLIVTIDGPTQEQMEALVEQEWDTTTYAPLDLQLQPDWEAAILAKLTQQSLDTGNPVPLNRWIDLPQADKDAKYLQYKEGAYERCRFPREYTNKRRFIIDPADLAAKGVDIDRMVDRSDQYDPQPEFTDEEIYDRVKKRKVDKALDNLNKIKPRTDQEIDDAQGQQGE